MELFDCFVKDADLVEYPLQARRFTWYRGNGTSKSRIDRWFCNRNWMRTFPNLFLRGGKRSLSDHYPLFLEEKVCDWGPKPFRSLNAWFEHCEFSSFISEKWSGYEVEGWGGFFIKEKLKRLKADVKLWNQKVFGRVEDRIEARRETILRLDILDDTFGLEEEEVIKRNHERALLIQDLKQQNLTFQQKAKLKWVKYGDANSAMFHRLINGRRRRNEINGLTINNEWRQDVREVKDFIRNQFEDHY